MPAFSVSRPTLSGIDALLCAENGYALARRPGVLHALARAGLVEDSVVVDRGSAQGRPFGARITEAGQDYLKTISEEV